MEQTQSVLILSDNPQAKESISSCFRETSRVDTAESLDAALDLFRHIHCDFAFCDLHILLSGVAAGEEDRAHGCLEVFWAIRRDAEIIVLCAPEAVRDAVEVVRAGANSYLIHPVDPSEVRYTVESTIESKRLREQLDSLRDQFWQKDLNHLVKTSNALMEKVISAIRSVAPTSTTVLLTGETGTGKGVLAKVIHQHSTRKNKPFVGVHCGAIPETLIESELFGHEKGAFTGAHGRKHGKFEAAAGGTIFLDEVGTMSFGAQIKLLKVLQEKTFQRVGGHEDIEADVRVIAAANRDLHKMCEQGEFRSDLYYRLSVFPVEIPPLRERKEDIPHMVEVFLRRLNATYGKGITGIRRSVLRAFEEYSWPGNIRELENVIERAYVLETTSMLSPQNFPPDVVPVEEEQPVVALDVSGSLSEVRRRATEEIEKKYLCEKLSMYEGRIDRTAQAAGISARQLHKLMMKYELRKESFRRRRGEG